MEEFALAEEIEKKVILATIVCGFLEMDLELQREIKKRFVKYRRREGPANEKAFTVEIPSVLADRIRPRRSEGVINTKVKTRWGMGTYFFMEEIDRDKRIEMIERFQQRFP